MFELHKVIDMRGTKKVVYKGDNDEVMNEILRKNSGLYMVKKDNCFIKVQSYGNGKTEIMDLWTE